MVDCCVDMLDGNQFMLYVTYGPREPEATTGLVVVKGQFVPGDAQNPDQVSLSPVGSDTRVPVFTDSGDAAVGRVTESYGKLYAAFGCHGIAVLTPGGWGEKPTIDATWTYPSTNPITDPKRVALQVRRIVGGTSGAILVMATFLNGGIGVFNPSNLAYLGEVTTPWQPNAMVTVTGAQPTTVPTIYLADGSGGVHRIEVTPP
jgi:hypothetical protein